MGIVKVAWQERQDYSDIGSQHALLKTAHLWPNNYAKQIILLSEDPTNHLEESNPRVQADTSDSRKVLERHYQCIDIFDPSGHYAIVFIIVSGKLTAASVNVKSALQIGKACMKPMTTNYIEVVFKRTLGIIGSEEFDLLNLFSHALAPIPTSLLLNDGSMISASWN